MTEVQTSYKLPPSIVTSIHTHVEETIRQYNNLDNSGKLQFIERLQQQATEISAKTAQPLQIFNEKILGQGNKFNRKMSPETAEAVGSVAGAVYGAMVGFGFGGPPGAVAGAAVGGIIGGVWGHLKALK